MINRTRETINADEDFKFFPYEKSKMSIGFQIIMTIFLSCAIAFFVKVSFESIGVLGIFASIIGAFIFIQLFYLIRNQIQPFSYPYGILMLTNGLAIGREDGVYFKTSILEYRKILNFNISDSDPKANKKIEFDLSEWIHGSNSEDWAFDFWITSRKKSRNVACSYRMDNSVNLLDFKNELTSRIRFDSGPEVPNFLNSI